MDLLRCAIGKKVCILLAEQLSYGRDIGPEDRISGNLECFNNTNEVLKLHIGLPKLYFTDMRETDVGLFCKLRLAYSLSYTQFADASTDF